MASAIFDKTTWQTKCQQLMNQSLGQAYTPMHRLFMFSQSIDEALMSVRHEDLDQAISIAQGFGYESWQERSEYVDWFTHPADAALPPLSDTRRQHHRPQ